MRSRLNSHSNNTFLWDLEELFLKYMSEDNRFKGILFPVMRRLVDLQQSDELLELCGRVFDEITQYEKELKRSQFIESLVKHFLTDTNNVISDDESEEREEDKQELQSTID